MQDVGFPSIESPLQPPLQLGDLALEAVGTVVELAVSLACNAMVLYFV